MSWQSLEERQLGLDPRKYTKKKWNPQDSFGYHKNMGPRPKTEEERFVEDNGWSLVDENDEQRAIEQFRRESVEQPDVFFMRPDDLRRSQLNDALRHLGGAVVSEKEREQIHQAMLKRLSGL